MLQRGVSRQLLPIQTTELVREQRATEETLELLRGSALTLLNNEAQV